MTRKSHPAGEAPYSAAFISLSVPSTPTRSTLTNTPRPFRYFVYVRLRKLGKVYAARLTRNDCYRFHDSALLGSEVAKLDEGTAGMDLRHSYTNPVVSGGRVKQGRGSIKLFFPGVSSKASEPFSILSRTCRRCFYECRLRLPRPNR